MALPFLICALATAAGCDLESGHSATGAEIATDAGLPAARSLNGRVIRAQENDAGYSVLFIGHAYGNFRNSRSDLPAASLLENTDRINRIEPAFVGLLGDNVRAPKDRNISNLRSHFGDAIRAPVFVIPGEHDLFRGIDVYRQAFGADYFWTEFGNELFVFLNTGGGSAAAADGISAAQYSFLERALARAASQSKIENIVILMHKVLWTELPRYQGLASRVNNDRRSPSWPAMHQLLHNLARSKRVIVGAGDIGHKSYSFLHDANPEDDITYFATGLADRESDSIVELHLPKDGPPMVRALSLTDQPILPAATELAGFLAWGSGP